MELTQVLIKIGEKIEALEALKAELPILSIHKADAIMDYEKEMAKVCLEMSINNYTMTLIDKLSKGKCADLKWKMDVAESNYKNCLKIIDITEAQLNGYQSINRHLSEL